MSTTKFRIVIFIKEWYIHGNIYGNTNIDHKLFYIILVPACTYNYFYVRIIRPVVLPKVYKAIISLYLLAHTNKNPNPFSNIT